MRLIYPVVALVGVLMISGCAHRDGSHHGGHDFAAKNYGLTYEQVREAAQDGDADAQYALGYMYYYGQNVTRNGNQARLWIAKAAAQNHQQAIRALKMMGTQSQYASRDHSLSDSARTAPLLNGAQANRWQEVRRPQATAEPEQLAPQELNKETQAAQAQSESASASANANSNAKPSQQANNAPAQLKKGKGSGQQTAASEKHQKAHKVAELRKKHTQAALHRKDRNKQLTSKKHVGAKTAARAAESESTDAADDLGQADEANDQRQALKGIKATQAGAQSKQASKGQVASVSGDDEEATVDSDDDAQEAPSLTSAQQKIAHPGQNTALKGNKQAKGQVGHANGKQGIASAKGNASLSSDERSILAAPANNYTVQLMGSGSKAAIQKVVANNQIQQKAKVYHTTLKGKDYFVLIYGSYPSQAAANAAIAHLPTKLQQLKPWVKPYTSVKSSIKTSA